MANLGGRQNASNFNRMLQYGLDAIVDHHADLYYGPSDEIYQEVSTNGKAFYDSLMIAGMGVAGAKAEGSVAQYDTMNQSSEWHPSLTVYSKIARVTMEAIKYNVNVKDLMGMVTRDLVAGLKTTHDIQAAYPFNNPTTSGVTYRDGLVMASASHTTQSGATYSNTVSANFSRDAVYNAITAIRKIVGENGLLLDLEAEKLVFPTDLAFTVGETFGSPYNPSNANNTINMLYGMDIKPILWKRLSSTTNWYLLTNTKTPGFVKCDFEGITTNTWNDNASYDTLASVKSINLWTMDDPRCVYVGQGS